MVKEFRKDSKPSGWYKVMMKVKFGKNSKMEKFWLRRKGPEGMCKGAPQKSKKINV